MSFGYLIFKQELTLKLLDDSNFQLFFLYNFLMLQLKARILRSKISWFSVQRERKEERGIKEVEIYKPKHKKNLHEVDFDWVLVGDPGGISNAENTCSHLLS